MNIESYLAQRQDRINTFLEVNILPDPQRVPCHLHQAMHYGVLNGGKRIRPLLVYATGEAFGADLSLLDIPASAVELIHAYSLVHDDLPAMDNDDLRRGMPTCHKAFDEATAILVGDALQTLAFSVLAEPSHSLDSQKRLAMLGCLARAAGSFGMAGGQALDLKATGQVLTAEQLQQIHSLKTGALIAASIQLGAITAHLEDPQCMAQLTLFASHIGLCFQIQDDILNMEGDVKLLGKKVGTDQTNQKATFATITGLPQAKESLQFYYLEAIKALEHFGDQVTMLKAIAEYMIRRDH
jgi:farnesyl diphosphate synthase